jgi:hypothetical protein
MEFCDRNVAIGELGAREMKNEFATIGGQEVLVKLTL